MQAHSLLIFDIFLGLQRITAITRQKSCGFTRLRLVSPLHFEHCDDAYSLSARDTSFSLVVG